MKRILIPILLFLLLMTVPSASAHPGRTDANGGHTDSSTGEYHYHHGYPAHQHYDMDGDGKKDCPYEFKDKTGSASGSSSSSSTSSNVTRTTTTSPTQKSSFWNQPVNGFYVVLFLIIIVISIPFVGYVLSKIIYFLLMIFDKLFP